MLWARCAAFVLCAFLVIGSLDSVPDPPAIGPHFNELKLCGSREAAADTQLHLDCSIATGVSSVPVRFIASPGEQAPRESTPAVALSRFASDPSPPIFVK